MRVHVNVDEKKTLTSKDLPELGGATIDVRVFPREERKAILARVFEAADDGGLGALEAKIADLGFVLDDLADDQLPWGKVKGLVYAKIREWVKDERSGVTKRQAQLIDDLQDEIPKSAICGWSGIQDDSGADVAFDAGLIMRLEPFEEISDAVLNVALPGFKQSRETAGVAAEIVAEGEERKNSLDSCESTPDKV